MKVYMKVKSIMPDRTNYKKYGTMYEPEDLTLELEIPESEVRKDGNENIISVKGMACLLQELASIPDTAEDNYLKTKASNQ